MLMPAKPTSATAKLKPRDPRGPLTAARALLLVIAFAGSALAQSAPKKPSPDDQYKLGPDSQPQAGVPQGKVMEFTMEDSKAFPGFTRKWWLYIPAPYNGTKPCALMVFQDGGGFVKRDGGWRVPVVLDNLIHKKELPLMAAIFINPGDKPLAAGEPPRKRPDGRPAPPRNRSVEYDTLSDAYARFLIDEVLPEARKHVKITDEPDGRGIGGSSSGGICAFTVAWERPDQFRKVLSFIGSYTNIRGGGKYPEMVGSAPKKPIRVFLQDGANDLVNQFGSWPEANKAMDGALRAKGYDVKLVFGEGSHNPKHGASILPEALRWLWRDYPR
ncbi:MAG: alpha/beta hydrolase-fold protein [Verrucomicrobiota bacterium]|nr:alpha/beta hydrolase-fold protein [Verrucomicrobiota bacterium]